MLRYILSRALPATSLGNKSCRPSLHGIGLRESAKSFGRFEIRRDGTIIFGIKDSTENLPLGLIYTIWYSGLHFLKDIQDHFSLSELAVVQAGLIGCAEHTVKWDEYSISDISLPDNQIPMDAIMTSEDWLPKTIFDTWAEQFANYLGKEQTITLPPWVSKT